MNVHFLRFSILGFALILLQACTKEEMSGPNMMEEEMMEEEEEDNTVYFSGDIFIEDTITTESFQKVVIEAGANLTFGPDGILVVDGDMIIEGTELEPILITGSQERVSHRVIQIRWAAEEFIMKHVEVNDGLITSVADWNHIANVNFYNTKPLLWSDALIRFWSSSLLLEDCTMTGINKGDGVLCHDMDAPVVRNCNFFQTPDAVEYINCNNGLITGNIFRDCGDDGVDQNGCFRTVISNNEFYNISDRALEIGSENFGRSDSIQIVNNLFVDCNVVVNVRQSSTVRVQHSTFFNNNVILDVQTHVDSTINSSAIMESSVIVGTLDENILLTGISTASVKNCMSDVDLDSEDSNVTSLIQFVDPSSGNFEIMQGSFPVGYNATSIGYQRQ